MSSSPSPEHRLRTGGFTTRLLALASFVVVVVACGRNKAPSPEPAQPSASAAAASVSPTSAPAPSGAGKSWCAGSWSGTYRAAAHHIELPTTRGGIPEWKADDGKAFVGPGTIELACADDGTVSGAAHGPLGEHEIRGDTGAESLHARLVPKSPASTPVFSGTITLSRTGTEVAGDLQASTPDGRVARTAAVKLTRSAEQAP